MNSKQTQTFDHTPLFFQAQLAQQKTLRRKKKPKPAAVSHQHRVSRHDKEQSTPKRSPAQQRGDIYETQAREHLQSSGCVILGHQLRCPVGELDLVMRDGSTLVFVEVRQRASSTFGGAAASVTCTKQRRVLRAARWFMRQLVEQHFGGATPHCRFDVLAFEPTGLVWHRDAFRLTLDK